MHVEEKLSTSVFSDDFYRPGEGINQMPMPMMKVYTYVLTPISNTMFRLNIRSCVISWDFNWHLENKIVIKVFF